MEIPRSLVAHYLAQVTVGWFARNELPPDAVDGYAPQVIALETLALRNGHLAALRPAFEALLAASDADLVALGGGRYPYDATELREIVRYLCRTLWPA